MRKCRKSGWWQCRRWSCRRATKIEIAAPAPALPALSPSASRLPTHMLAQSGRHPRPHPKAWRPVAGPALRVPCKRQERQPLVLLARRMLWAAARMARRGKGQRHPLLERARRDKLFFLRETANPKCPNLPRRRKLLTSDLRASQRWTLSVASRRPACKSSRNSLPQQLQWALTRVTASLSAQRPSKVRGLPVGVARPCKRGIAYRWLQ